MALHALAAACRRVQDADDLLALPDARARLAYVLAHLATATSERIVWATHEELATLAVTRCMLPDLRERRLIGYEQHRRGIRVLNNAGLVALSPREM